MTQTHSEANPSIAYQDSLPKKTTYNLTVSQSLFSGSMAGAMEVLVNHPLWTIKTRMQSGEPFTLNPKLLYRGILPNAASMIPITAVQMGLNRSFQTMVFSNSYELSNVHRMISAFTAGVGSAFISTPTEMVMSKQAKDGISFYGAAMRLADQRGFACLYTGFVGTALRDGLFTASLLVARPVLKTQLKTYCFNNDYMASLASGVISGVGATLATQGFDTVKTRQQTAAQPAGFLKTVQELYLARGVHGFFKGSIPRGTRVVSAVTLMGGVNEKIEKAFTQYNDSKSNLSIKRS